MPDEKQTKRIIQICLKQLAESTDFKRPRMEKIRRYEDAYYGKEKQTFRVQFNIPLPVLSGMVDALKDAFDDELAMRFTSDHPADKLRIDKWQALFDREANSLRSNAMWDYKTRCDKFLAIISGRGILKTFAQSDPEFLLNFSNVDYHYFHCEPKGGGHLATHLFKGEEGIFKTKRQLEKGVASGLYDPEAVKIIIASGAGGDRKVEDFNDFQEKLSRFKALGFDADNHNYVGDQVHNLCEWYPTIDGEQWYVLFDPWTHQAARIAPRKEVFESGLDPYSSWATHEDPKVFWSKCYCDDFFVAHDSIRTSLSQEFTNRQKKNMTPKYYDPELVDASRLDRAQYDHDALVPVSTKGGTRKISEGIYQFEHKELGSATIDLVEWLSTQFKVWTGTQEISDQSNAKVPANVVYSKLQSASKRLSHRAKSFREAYAEAGLRAFHGASEHLSGEVAVKILGPKGYGFDYISHQDFRLEGQLDPTVVSKSEEDELNVMGKEQKVKAVDKILSSESLQGVTNPKKLAEIIYKDIGGWNDDDVAALMDMSEFQSAQAKNKADVAILSLCKGQMPDLVYDADTGFLQRIMLFEKDHRSQLAKKLPVNEKGEIAIFYQYLLKHAAIVMENMNRLADQILMERQVGLTLPNQNQNVPSGSPGRGALPVKTAAMLPNPAATAGVRLNLPNENANQFTPTIS